MDHSVEHKQSVEKEDNPHLFNKVLKFVSYPASAVLGLWVAEREVHEVAYDNLKRFGAFKDILQDLQPKNEANILARGKSEYGVKEFISKSSITKSAYSQAVGERMAHFGLGNDIKDFPAKWNYIRDSGKRAAVINGLTAFGISIGALLTIANSKSLIDYFAGDKDKNDHSR